LIAALLAAAGLSDIGSGAALLITLAAAAVVPIYWISHGSWTSVLGLVLLGLDIVVGYAVGRPLYRFLHRRLHIPDWIIGVPLILLVAIPVAIVNILATFGAARWLPSSLFGFL
jgi:uncharacterized membrane protein